MACCLLLGRQEGPTAPFNIPVQLRSTSYQPVQPARGLEGSEVRASTYIESCPPLSPDLHRTLRPPPPPSTSKASPFYRYLCAIYRVVVVVLSLAFVFFKFALNRLADSPVMSSRLTTPVSKLTRSISSTASAARPSHVLSNGSKGASAAGRKRQSQAVETADMADVSSFFFFPSLHSSSLLPCHVIQSSCHPHSTLPHSAQPSMSDTESPNSSVMHLRPPATTLALQPQSLHTHTHTLMHLSGAFPFGESERIPPSPNPSLPQSTHFLF
ncbi:hypothetical protein B0T17DRAFT_78440 [Bombardia bombarda]|uniref:Uncharacterized protein n=1 Tax=Bombardia bombarda TaxID=252184 RepID=A0AA39XMI8_9PEZI|nr:hypothetical protein B0T17DRAFT_78440 [Bombardia bombarda]